MAVTQQLARVDPPLLAACRASVKVLDDVCSFKALPADAYVDADWAPALLLAAADAEPLSNPHRKLLTQAFQGDVEVNPAYREFPDSIFEHPVTATEPDVVPDVAAVLARLVELSFPSPRSVMAALASQSTDFSPTALREYLLQHLEAVAGLYQDATARGDAVLTWWD